MEIATGIRARIFEAANALYEEAGRLLFPTVDAVRKRARANMNDANTYMKEWRRAQTAQIAPVPVQVPSAIQQTNSAALAEIWLAAVTLANDSLRVAQSGWDAERVESETLAQQMATAFEEQAAELDAANVRVAELQIALSDAAAEAGRLRNQLDKALSDAGNERNAASQAQAKAIEIERRANDLRVELDRSHQQLAMANENRAAEQLRSDREAEELRAEIRKVKEDADIECGRAQAALTSALTTAAKLSGQVEALTVAAPAAADGRPRKKPTPDGHAKGEN